MIYLHNTNQEGVWNINKRVLELTGEGGRMEAVKGVLASLHCRAFYSRDLTLTSQRKLGINKRLSSYLYKIKIWLYE
jgi:hypothetical protein